MLLLLSGAVVVVWKAHVHTRVLFLLLFLTDTISMFILLIKPIYGLLIIYYMAC